MSKLLNFLRTKGISQGLIGFVILKRSDYVNSLNSIFNNPSKFSPLNNYPTNTRLTTVQHYLSTLRNCGEISDEDFKFMRPKAASFGRAHGAPKTQKDFIDLPTQPGSNHYFAVRYEYAATLFFSKLTNFYHFQIHGMEWFSS